jgi:transcriptional regulator NrdR family protein
MIAMATSENVNPGIACRKCGCSHVPAYKTIDVRERTMRYRECRHCGYRFTTYESLGKPVNSSIMLPPGNSDD